MNALALALEVCRELGIRDPAELYALPPGVADLWTEHVRNKLTNGYRSEKE